MSAVKKVKAKSTPVKAAKKAAKPASKSRGKSTSPKTAKQKVSAKASPKAKAKTTKAAPKADDTRKITVLDKDFQFGREGTARNKAWLACIKAKTVSDYAKAGGALKYLPRWVAAGAITLG